MCRAARCGNSPTNRIRKNIQNFWLCRRMRRTPGRTTMQHGGGTDRTAAPQGPCPLPSTARRTGIGSRDDAPPPHGHAARSAGAAFSAQNASESEYRQSRSRGIRRSRKKGLAERSRVKRSFTKAQASRPWIHAAFGPCGHGLPCGNEYCRLCRSKTIRPAQRCQHGSMTEPFVLKMLQVSGKAEARSAVHTLLAAALRDRMPNRDSARRGSATPPLPVQPQLTCGVRLRWRRETCGPEHRVWPADIFKSKTLQGQIGCKICTDKALPRFAESSLDRK